jgi:membrane associated rhomboid family serine protease
MRSAPTTLSFPPFTRAIKILIAINTGVFLLMLVLNATGQGDAVNAIESTFGLTPHLVVHGRIYQLLTYGFVHEGFFHLFFNMLMLWMFGSMIERYFGNRQFWEFYLFGVFGAGLTSVVLAYSFAGMLHTWPNTLTIGASGGIYAILMAAAMLYGDQEVFLFLFTFTMRLKYLVAILALIALVSSLGGGGNVANVAHLGGLLFGYLYLKFVPRRGLTFAFSEGYYGVRNFYHRWKRNQAKKKFQVYMRKHEKDPKQYFDEYGNFKPPGDGDEKDQGGWVN